MRTMLQSSIKLGLLAVPLFSLAAISGCKKPEYPACKKDKHCEEGESCVEGLCQNCQSDTDCVGKGPNGEDLTCVDFRCGSEGGQSGAGELGDPCSSNADCVGGWVCKEGVCSACSADEECPNGACSLDSGRCASGCTEDSDCPMDEICDGGQCVFSGNYDNDEVLCGLEAVYFAFDSPKLSPAAQQALTNAAECIKEQNREVILEAHADSIGTEEYNILLTDKRGQGVKQFLNTLGVENDFMTVVSKGSLEASGNSESERAKDRRVQFIWQ